MPCVLVQLSKKAEQDQDENDIENILDGSATQTVCGFISVQPKADQYEGTTIETTDVGFYVCWWRNGSVKHEHLDSAL